MRIAVRIYALLLRLYPSSFQAEFGEEMQAVFAEAAAEAAKRGGFWLAVICLREMRDLPVTLLKEHLSILKSTKDEAHMNEANENATEAQKTRNEPGSWIAALAGAVPFIVHPLPFALMQAIPALAVLLSARLTEPVLVRYAGNIWLGTTAFYMIALTVGWVKGFPLWSYPYWVMGLVFSMYMMNVATPGLVLFNHRFQSDELWGWRSWIPLAVVAVVCLLSTRSVWPLRRLVNDLVSDWTRYSFGLYAVMPFLLWISFDEMHGEESYEAGLLVLMALGAFVYIRCAKTWQRALALFAGLTVVWMAATVYISIYWHGRQEVWMPEAGNGFDTAWNMIGTLLTLLSLMFAPAIPGLIRRFTPPARPA